MGVALLMLIGWVAVIVCGIILILRGRDTRKPMLVALGSLLISAFTVYCILTLLF